MRTRGRRRSAEKPDSRSENEKVRGMRMRQGVCASEEERERSYSQPSSTCLMNIASFNQEEICMYSNQTQNTPFAWSTPALLVCSVASCLLEEHRKQAEGKKNIRLTYLNTGSYQGSNSEKGKAGGIAGELLCICSERCL